MRETKRRQTPWTWSLPGEPLPVTQRRPLAMAAAELEALWRDHAERAEGPGGLHAFLCTVSPGYLPVVSYLRAEQRAIVDDLQKLHQAAQRSSSRSSWLRAEYGRLARAVVEHDELETEILCVAIERG